MKYLLFLSITFVFFATVLQFAQTSRNWNWISGSNSVNQPGVYGTKGIASSSNIPGARSLPVSWIDADDNVWLFGGYYINNNNVLGRFNDLWKYDGMNWTWISGSNLVGQLGTYGTQGIPSSSNTPGARDGSVTWIDSTNALWLFGGYGYDTITGPGYLNDLWKFNGANWTWISGPNSANQLAVYGIQGIASSSNIPGARGYRTATWIDSSNNIWLFGGLGWDSTGNLGALNDLWKFDGVNWTWISGPNSTNQRGNYGIQGIASSSNIPGARYGSVFWKDSTNTFWLFGGYGIDVVGNNGQFNDLWKYDGVNWTWISGSNRINQPGTYGTKGITSSSNIPGGRSFSIIWKDSSDTILLFGGESIDGRLNDLWKFDGMNWTWISGSNSTNQLGTYGTKGIPSSSNTPGARGGAVSWKDSNNTFWLFGGGGNAATVNDGFLNDLWKYELSNEITTSTLTTSRVTTSALTTSAVTTSKITTSALTTSTVTTSTLTTSRVTSSALTTSALTTSAVTTSNDGESGTPTIRTTSILFIVVGVLLLIV